MSGIKRSGAISSGLLFAAAVAFPVLAQEPRGIVPPEPSVSNPSALVPIAERHTEFSLPPNRHDYAEPACPPHHLSRFGRFKERCRAKCWGYPEEFDEPPFGTSLYTIRATQIARGQAARMVFYQYDFLPASEQLNSRGRAQLARIGMWSSTNSFPIFVEPTSANLELDELRRQAVWSELSSGQCFIPSERVIVGRPISGGLNGIDALLIDRNRAGLTAIRGVSSGGSGMATSSNSSGATAR